MSILRQGYEKEPSAKYPVLYLIHGFGDNHATWTQHGKAHWILDNLIAQKKAKPMIVVMPDGHPVAPGSGARDQYGMANSAALEKEIMEEMIPMIEGAYRVQNGAGNRAIAGLSMGGGHSLYTGLRHLDDFAWIGAFSAGVPGQDRLAELFHKRRGSEREAKAILDRLRKVGLPDRTQPANGRVADGERYSAHLA
jgi:enterochelin esterase family protein